jgi:ABC-2 type transport system ATP-binding protein
MIEIRNVTKRYGDKRAVDDVSFDVAAGESVSLWGSNGAGKTTLIRCMLGSTKFEGDITIDGVSSKRQGKEVRHRIGYVPQTMPTFDMSVGEMVLLIARLRGATARDGLDRLEEFGLSHTKRQSVASLSGGMRQKLALTLALLGNPRVLMFDEPTANLDARSQNELIRMLVDLKQQGRTVVFTSHRWSEVRSLADTVVHLEMGKHIGGGSVSDMAIQTDRVSLRMELSEEQIGPAITLLDERGFRTMRNGTSVLVSVQDRVKADPVMLLAGSGYEILNFDLQDEE